jgi:hypothetical protein
MGRLGEKASDQDVPGAFDFGTSDDDPYPTVTGVRDALGEHRDVDVTDEAVRARLERMGNDGSLEKHRSGPGVAYRATVALRLSDGARAAAAGFEGEFASGETDTRGPLRASRRVTDGRPRVLVVRRRVDRRYGPRHQRAGPHGTRTGRRLP